MIMTVLIGKQSGLLVFRGCQLHAAGHRRKHDLASLELHLKLHHARVPCGALLKHPLFPLTLPDDDLVELLPSHYGFQLIIVRLDKVLDGLVLPQVVSEPLPKGEVRFLRFNGHLDALRGRCRLNLLLLRKCPLNQRG
jgi:hypothetical protein